MNRRRHSDFQVSRASTERSTPSGSPSKAQGEGSEDSWWEQQCLAWFGKATSWRRVISLSSLYHGGELSWFQEHLLKPFRLHRLRSLGVVATFG